MSNCKDEFIKQVGDKEILCAVIVRGDESYMTDIKKFLLPVGYTSSKLEAFLKSINFSYDSGYGGQEVFGNIWYKDGAWSERGEYDGSEWWEYKKCPEIPVDLLKNKVKG